MEHCSRHSTKKPFAIVAGKANPAAAGPALADLPPRDTVHWVSRHKATIVAAVQNGVISLYDARKRYDLSVEELLSWELAIACFGSDGLCAKQAQLSRRPQR